MNIPREHIEFVETNVAGNGKRNGKKNREWREKEK